MSKLTNILITICVLTLVGCGKTKTSSTQQEQSVPVLSNTPGVGNSSPLPPQPTTSSPVTTNIPQPQNSSPNASPTTPNSAVLTDSKIITSNSIGVAKVGMTLGELKQILKGKAEFQVKSGFMVDFDAIAIIQQGKTQYYILYPAGSPMRDIDLIEALVTDNPNYKTAEGISPGTSLQQAETVYGDATLSYNLAHESREYVKFLKQPSKDIAFRLGAGNDNSLAGIYSSPQKELNETKEFKKTATIRRVEVYCGANCPPQPLP